MKLPQHVITLFSPSWTYGCLAVIMGAMATGRDWSRLAARVRERRDELGLTQEDVRAAGGPSTATMRLIEGALQEAYQLAIITRLERVLEWERGSARRILDGGEPVLAGAPGEPAPVWPRREPADGDDAFTKSARYDLVRMDSGIPPEEIFETWALPMIADEELPREAKVEGIAGVRRELARSQQQESGRPGRAGLCRTKIAAIVT